MIYSADEKGKQYLRNRYRIGVDIDIIDAILKNEITVIVRSPMSEGIPCDAVLTNAACIEDYQTRLFLTYDSPSFQPKDEFDDQYKFEKNHHIVEVVQDFTILPNDKVTKIMELYKQIQEIIGDADGGEC